MGGLWGPLLFPVLAAGLLARRSGQEAGQGISSPPAGLALSGQRSCPGTPCPGPTWPKPAPLTSAQASQSGNLTPYPLTSPRCRPHVLHHLHGRPCF